MAWKMDINLSGNTFTDELHSDVGSVVFRLNHDWFIDLSINTASGGGGTGLELGTDYELSVEATDLSERVTDELGESKNVWGKVQIINATYQTGDLYFSGKYIADSVEAKDVYRNILTVDDEDYDILPNDDYDEIQIDPATGDRSANFPDATIAALVGRPICIRNIGDGSYKITFTLNGTDKIIIYSGNEKWELESFELLQAGDWAEFQSDGTNWVKINAPYWHKVDDPATGNKAEQTSGWTADSFTGGLEVTFNSLPVGALIAKAPVYQVGTMSEVYFRKSGDANISNTPNATGERSHRILSSLDRMMPADLWLSSDLKTQIAVTSTDTDITVHYPIAYLQ